LSQRFDAGSNGNVGRHIRKGCWAAFYFYDTVM
jgi:hypothetical protein